MKNDFDFIKDKFDADNLSAPDTISENNILNKLNDKPRLKLYQKKGFKAFVSAAACFALVMGIFAYAAPKHTLFPTDTPTADLQNNSVVTSFESYADIKKAVDKFNKQQLYYAYFADGAKSAGETDIAETVSDEASITSDNSYAQTYVQVNGVDEADILKNDGRYIYFVNDNNEILIYEGEKQITTISDFAIKDNTNTKQNDVTDSEYDYSCTKYVNDIYVKADKLIVNVTRDEFIHSEYVPQTDTYIYDTTDISNPRQFKNFSQSGSYSTSRLIDNMLYIVSNRYLYDCKKEEDCYISTAENGNDTILPAASIKCGESISDTNFLVLSAINIDTQERTADTKAFMGCSSTVYCSKSNMYITINGMETEIVKAELTEREIKFTASAKVNGYVNNQFSMDERNGCFRIATSDDVGNNLYILDSNLSKISEITGFAENEQIQAVKYIGDMAYVITYEFTDPLFVIDLSDVHNPEIKGSVEITGFSSQLVSVDENTLLGIGYDDSYGIKLALFDISNPSSPAVLDSYSLLGASSNAQHNHKAIMINKEKNYYAIDFYQNTEYDFDTGAIAFEIKDNKIYIINKHIITPSDYGYAARVTFIGNTNYILDSEGQIYSFEQ